MQSTYTTQAKVEAYLQRDLTAAEIVQLPAVINYLSDFVRNYTNRNWLDVVEGTEYEPTLPAAEERYYDSDHSRELAIPDDFDGSEEVIVDLLNGYGQSYVTLTTTSDPNPMILYPLNDAIKNRIHLRFYTFTCGPSRVKLTAVFTSGEVPNGVVAVVSALVGNFLQRSANTTGFSRETIEGYTYQLQTSADSQTEDAGLLSSLDLYKKIIL